MLRKILDNVVSVFVILIVVFLIVPLPAAVLDFLLIINIALSLFILLTTMYIREALEFSIFPSLLLITTLFRLALNVSSTKLILGNGGEAGAVIATFGEFVIGGNAIVGFLVFLIIVMIQFLVITKGSERVAEVAARFTLDAMPGKQMAIDADLNTGIITEQQATERRRKIQREADFYGAMDGASKFVKGDAVMSLVITAINIIGGIAIGMLQGGMEFDTVMSVYLIATVGDGLCSQIPALLISTATGMVVTRSASEGSMSEDVINQFGGQPVALIITGIALIALMMLPGFPWMLLLVMGILFIGLGVFMLRARQRPAAAAAAAAAEAAEPPPMREADFYRDPENVYSIIGVDPIEMEFGYSLIPLVDENQGSSFIDRVVLLRKKFAQEMGTVIPTVTLRDNGQLAPSEYRIKIKGEAVSTGEVLVGHYLVMDAGGGLDEVDGIDTVEPAFHLPAKWVSGENREAAEIAGYSVIDPQSVIITHLSEIIRKYAYELTGRQEVSMLIQNLEKTNKALVEEVVGVTVTTAEIARVISNLLKEGIPVKDLVTILETLGEYGQATKDTDMLTEYTRQALKRTITRKYSADGAIKVLTLDNDLETAIINSIKRTDAGAHMTLDPATIQHIVTTLYEQTGKMEELELDPIVLTSPGVRIYFKRLIEQFMPNVAVLSYSEIENQIQIQSFGVIKAA